MRKFKDNQGNEWTIVFTVGDAMRLRREIGFDVNTLISKTDHQLEEILQDENKILEILVLVLEDQIIRRGLVETNGDKTVLAESFGMLFSGNTLDEATIAFLYAVADSFPKLKRRGLIAILEQLSPAMDTATEAMEAKIQSMDLKTMINKKMAEL